MIANTRGEKLQRPRSSPTDPRRSSNATKKRRVCLTHPSARPNFTSPTYTGDWIRHEGGKQNLSEVIIHDDENFERALKRFKKKCEKAGILSDLRKHRHYEKPSERRKRKLNTAMRKNRRTRHV
jgi:small subunit ribosomal protein S21